MIEFGKTLRDAREAKGYTISQIAETTHMLSSIVQDLENEDFSKIAAPIYGRGFVKLYCETIGIDAKPLIAEFMEIYNGNRTPAIRERNVRSEPAPAPAPTPAAPEPEPAPVPEPIASEPPLPDEPEPFVLQQETVSLSRPHPEPEPIRDAPPPPDINTLIAPRSDSRIVQPNLEDPQHPADPAPQGPRLSRYASPLQDANEPATSRLPSFSLPENFWRMSVLVLGALAVVIAIGFGIRALYTATTAEPVAEEAIEPSKPPAEPPAEPTAEPTRTPDKRQPRTPQRIPALYAD